MTACELHHRLASESVCVMNAEGSLGSSPRHKLALGQRAVKIAVRCGGQRAEPTLLSQCLVFSSTRTVLCCGAKYCI